MTMLKYDAAMEVMRLHVSRRFVAPVVVGRKAYALVSCTPLAAGLEVGTRVNLYAGRSRRGAARLTDPLGWVYVEDKALVRIHVHGGGRGVTIEELRNGVWQAFDSVEYTPRYLGFGNFLEMQEYFLLALGPGVHHFYLLVWDGEDMARQYQVDRGIDYGLYRTMRHVDRCWELANARPGERAMSELESIGKSSAGKDVRRGLVRVLNVVRRVLQ